MEDATVIGGYRELARQLREQIEAGKFPPGAQLPTELELSRWYGLNRHTVRSALQDLCQKGYIYKVRGKGTFVARRKIPYPISPATSFTASVEQLGIEGSRALLRAHELPVRPGVAALLGLRAGDPVVSLEILRSIERIPACLTVSFLPLARFPGLASAAQGIHSLYDLLRERYDVKGIHRVWSEIEAGMPGPRDTELLQMPAHMPILLSRSLVKDANGASIEYCVSRHRSDAYILRVNLEEQEERERR